MSVKNLTFVNNNPPACDDEYLNSVKSEINNAITQSGQSLTGIGDSEQLSKGISNYVASGAFYGCTNTGDAYTLTPLSLFKGITAYKDGQLVRFRPSATNTTQSPTINVNSQGPKNITKADGSTQVDIGDIDTNQDIELRYDLGNDVFVIPKLKSTSLIPTLYIGGISTENDAGDTDHDIKFNIGSCRDIADTQDIILASALVKQLDAVWTAGTGLGGRASAVSLSANTTYHMFVIAKVDGTVDAGFDTALNAVNLLSDATGYTKYRRVGSMKTDSSANWLGYNQFEKWFYYKLRKNDLTATSISTSRTAITLTVPIGIEVIANISANWDDAAEAEVFISSADYEDFAVLEGATPTQQITFNIKCNADGGNVDMNLLTNTSGQIYYRASQTTISGFTINTRAFYDPLIV